MEIVWVHSERRRMLKIMIMVRTMAAMSWWELFSKLKVHYFRFCNDAHREAGGYTQNWTMNSFVHVKTRQIALQAQVFFFFFEMEIDEKSHR